MTSKSPDHLIDLKELRNLNPDSLCIITVADKGHAKTLQAALKNFFNEEVIINEKHDGDYRAYRLIAINAPVNLTLYMQGYAMAVVAQYADRHVRIEVL